MKRAVLAAILLATTAAPVLAQSAAQDRLKAVMAMMAGPVEEEVAARCRIRLLTPGDGNAVEFNLGDSQTNSAEETTSHRFALICGGEAFPMSGPFGGGEPLLFHLPQREDENLLPRSISLEDLGTVQALDQLVVVGQPHSRTISVSPEGAQALQELSRCLAERSH